MNLKFIILLNFIFFPFLIKAQDINFSQFYELPLLRNPSLAGMYKGGSRISTAIRSQWASVSVPYFSQAVSADMRFGISKNSDNYLALGLQITNDVAGDSKLGKLQFLPLLAFHKSLSSEKDMYLSIGFMGGPVQQRFDPTKLKFDDQFVNGAYSSSNPTQQTFSNTAFTYLDGAVGLTFSNTFGNDIRFYVGAAFFHFTNPKVAFNKQNDIVLNRKYVLNGGLSAPTSDYSKIILYADYFTQGGNRQAQGGFIYKHDLIIVDDESLSISGGIIIRWNDIDAIIPLIKLDRYKWGFGLSYDINTSKLHQASQMRGGFELTFSFRDFLNINNNSTDKTRCPISVY